MNSHPIITKQNTHPWLKKVNICFVPGKNISPLINNFAIDLLQAFQDLGHIVQKHPDDLTDILLTSAPYNQDISWRHSLVFTSRIRFKIKHSPVIFCCIHVTPQEFNQALENLERALEKTPPDPEDFSFSGLAHDAYEILYEQGKRGGAILALERVLQAQSKSIHVLLLVGEDTPQRVFHFDLVGGYPQSVASDKQTFFVDTALRMVTTVSTVEVTDHQVIEPPLSKATWDALRTPVEMQAASRELGKRNFFTEPVQINRLVQVPAVSEAIASQYSEGCFSTWDPQLGALITTITGSTRPVRKSQISEDELTIITGLCTGEEVGDHNDKRRTGERLRANKICGVNVRHVKGKRNDPPSSEAVEMLLIDQELPKIELHTRTGNVQVPVIRSKLHGHRGVSAYNPLRVEHVHLDAPFYSYPVTCATEAQAIGIQDAFRRSVALNNPADQRQIVFCILPTHGVMIVEKWAPGMAPFEVIWQAIDHGDLVIDNRIPQGRVSFELHDERMILE